MGTQARTPSGTSQAPRWRCKTGLGLAGGEQAHWLQRQRHHPTRDSGIRVQMALKCPLRSRSFTGPLPTCTAACFTMRCTWSSRGSSGRCPRVLVPMCRAPSMFFSAGTGEREPGRLGPQAAPTGRACHMPSVSGMPWACCSAVRGFIQWPGVLSGLPSGPKRAMLAGKQYMSRHTLWCHTPAASVI